MSMEDTASYEAIDTYYRGKGNNDTLMLASVLGEETMKERVAKVTCCLLMPHLKSRQCAVFRLIYKNNAHRKTGELAG